MAMVPFLLSRLLIAALLAATATAPATTIEIDADTVEDRISPMLYGQFIEFMFEGVKGGLHAELIRDRGFDEPPNAIGLPRDWERYPDDRNDDYGLAFAREDAGYPTDHALRVELKSGVIARHGVYQPRVPIKGGVEYRGYVWLKADAAGAEAATVTVALEADAAGGRIYDEARVVSLGGRGASGAGWTKYAFTLAPKTSDPLARFAILFDGAGTLWLDQVSLMPGDAVDVVRGDVFAKVKALAPAFIRWPGGNVAQDYRWQWGVGPRDERPTWVNLSWKHERESGDFGTDEFIRFARGVGAEPSITVNVEGRGATAEEAAAWVEYCNGPASSTYGSMRARNGHPEPYGVKFWEIGNEIWGDWVRGHSDAETYARNLTRYVAAMRAVDPAIQVIAVGDNDMAWNRAVLHVAARGGARERIDFLAIHHYSGRRDMKGDPRNLLARPLHYERFYGEVEEALRELPPDRRPRLAINEWGLDLPESQQYSMLAALYGARLMNVFERRSPLVAMSAVSDLVNGWPGGIIQASRHSVFVSPIYLVNRLYATHIGAERLAARADSPALDIVASRSADGRRIYIKAVNTDLERPLTATIRVRGARVSPRAMVERVVASTPDAVNGFATPEAITVTRESIASTRLTLPSRSVSVIILTVAR
jgi:alpha-N-arabinofuranosidase